MLVVLLYVLMTLVATTAIGVNVLIASGIWQIDVVWLAPIGMAACLLVMMIGAMLDPVKQVRR